MPVDPTPIDRIPTEAPYVAVTVTGNADVSYGSTTGPFVAIDAWTTGDRIYINQVTGGQIAEAFGWTHPDETAKLHAEIEHLRSETVRLLDELAEARADRVVPLAEVLDLAKAREKRRPANTAA